MMLWLILMGHRPLSIRIMTVPIIIVGELLILIWVKIKCNLFLISSAKFWIDFYHIDGIRVDAVSNMLYLDYDEGPWQPNIEGNNRNLEGYYFLQRLNTVLKLAHPDVMMIAEESTATTQITGRREEGGLGFDYKWNMGWMNDILKFYEEDPIYRKYDFNLVTFSFMYLFFRKFYLTIFT